MSPTSSSDIAFPRPEPISASSTTCSGAGSSRSGGGTQPDTYEQPFHRLDLSITQDLPESLRLKLSGTNLLNQRVKLLQGQVEVLGYDPGVAAIVSLEWTYDRNAQK